VGYKKSKTEVSERIMVDKKIAIQSLKLKLGNKEVELTIEEAKELKAALDGLFEKEIVKEVCNKWWWYPVTYQYYQNPVHVPYIQPCGTPVENPITWGSTTIGMCNGNTLTVSNSGGNIQ
jgi:hypothetical protein